MPDTATSRSCPVLVVAGSASGVGKTTVVAGLARLLARRGIAVRVFKCGPDFVDPLWHELASGAPVHNLDLWMTGEAHVRQRLFDAAAGADVLLIEGVMGLYDGTPSTADLARFLGAPVLAVLPAAAVAQTFGALALGLRLYAQQQEQPLRLAGVLANQVAGPGHAAMLRDSLLPGDHWLGWLPRQAAAQLHERGPGLDAPDPGDSSPLARLDAVADLLAATPLGELDLADWKTRFETVFAAPEKPLAETARLLSGRRIAIAQDAAFSFIYPANVEALQALGAQTVFFSPLAWDGLPACDAVWLPGGYPERHLSALGACAVLQQDLKTHAAAGKVIWAEGGGLLALLEQFVDEDDVAHPMWGVLPGQGIIQPGLAGYGLQVLEQGLRLPSGQAAHLRGHSLHRARVRTAAPICAQTRHAAQAGRDMEAVYAQGSVRASFFHPWFASDPAATAALFLEATHG